jgi:AcrR family transcriptional regulator
MLMLSKGMSRTRLSEVLTHSRVQKGNFYYYFTSKEELGVAVIRERGLKLVDEWLLDTCLPDGDPWENIKRTINKLSTTPEFSGGWDNPVATLMHEINRVNGELRVAVGETLGEVGKQLAREFVRLHEAGRMNVKTDPSQLAFYLLSVIQGAAMLKQDSFGGATSQSAIELALVHVGSYIRSS